MRALPLALLAAAACGRPVTPELAAARARYQEARNGPAGQLAPELVDRAYRAEAAAERMHEEYPGSVAERDLGYVAERLARLAIAEAQLTEASQRLVDANRSYAAAEEHADQAALQTALADLSRARAQLASAEERLAHERDACRAPTERTVTRVVASGEETHVRLASDALFAPGTAELVPAGRRVLDEVAATALREPGSRVRIEGIGAGSEAAGGTELSRRRAEAVRAYLIDRGVPAARIDAVGAEGRAADGGVDLDIVRNAPPTEG